MKPLQQALEALKGGYYGTAEIVKDYKHKDFYLVRVEIADPYEDWECAEYHLLKKDLTEDHYLAHCDGYNGIDYKMSDDELAELLGYVEVEDFIVPYELTGELLAEAKRATLTEADEDYEGECKVWVEYCYSDGTLGAPVDGFVLEDEEAYYLEARIFDSYADAQKWIDEQESETYYLSHGEMDRPTYTIVQA